MPRFFLSRVAIIFVSSIALISAISAQAQNTLEVNVSGSFSPEGSAGLIISQGNVIQKPIIKHDSVSEEVTMVTMSTNPAEIPNGAVASAIIIGADGQAAFGDVKELGDKNAAKSFYTMPECPANPKLANETSDDLGYLQRLTEFRAARREGQQLLLAKKMDPQLIEKLKRLEKGFGFQYTNNLSPELTAFELVNRLSRLTNAIKNYQTTAKTK